MVRDLNSVGVGKSHMLRPSAEPIFYVYIVYFFHSAQ